jgi:ferredoxin-NADP reductase
LRVQTFPSAQEFLAFPRPDVPSCLVLDVQLPGLSGLDLQEELAKADVQTPIIFLTGHGDIPMTRAAPKDWPRSPGRIDATLIAHTAWPSTLFPTCYVCGPTSFVESATGFLTASGNDPDKIRTERFGPTGDRQ